MSQRPNFNRTRTSTFRPFLANYTNQSNDSNFTFNRNSFDDDPDSMFYLLTALIIPSMLCFAFLFYNFIHLPQLRTRSTNLLIICLLINNFIHILVDLPFRLYFLFENRVPFLNPTHCLIWTCYDNILTTTDLLIMAFTSIERYFSIFHHFFLHKHERLFYHIPIILCFLIPATWYTVLIFAYPCQKTFTYSTFQCGPVCYLTSSQVLVNIENFGFFMFPLFVIVIGNTTLIICVIIQKASMKRKLRLSLWRNNLRMISQLMFIAVLYMSIYVPSCILLIFSTYVQRTRFQPWAAYVRSNYFIHLKYIVIFGCPFMVLAGQKEMHQKIKNLFARTRCQRRVRRKTDIHPLTMMNTQNRKE
ncbi:unnamed protein product [Adineta steineri]|uniref:G-protein coupled receptors family 1 profile domain-containing protein n=1 Tax=Adineta steineri TaxID=433720 RepID=A0A815GKJ5_9BILA|nr:unnamed protein product [Adineta steineri]CAF3714446.1 unnamed protein product [Adineta steineri]